MDDPIIIPKLTTIFRFLEKRGWKYNTDNGRVYRFIRNIGEFEYDHELVIYRLTGKYVLRLRFGNVLFVP